MDNTWRKQRVVEWPMSRMEQIHGHGKLKGRVGNPCRAPINLKYPALNACSQSQANNGHRLLTLWARIVGLRWHPEVCMMKTLRSARNKTGYVKVSHAGNVVGYPNFSWHQT